MIAPGGVKAHPKRDRLMPCECSRVSKHINAIYIYIYIYVYVYLANAAVLKETRCKLLDYANPAAVRITWETAALLRMRVEGMEYCRHGIFMPWQLTVVEEWHIAGKRTCLEKAYLENTCTDGVLSPAFLRVSSPRREGRPRTEAVRFQRRRCNLQLSRNAADCCLQPSPSGIAQKIMAYRQPYTRLVRSPFAPAFYLPSLENTPFAPAFFFLALLSAAACRSFELYGDVCTYNSRILNP